MLMLLALAGCGQMGPLQLPEAPATTSGDQDSDDDER
jgi:predicted small lipoprotein YifL